jgi:hypothetical protein
MLHQLLLVLFKCPGDIPGSIKRKVNAILVSIGLTMVITTIILFSKPFYPFNSNHCYNLFCVATFCLWFRVFSFLFWLVSNGNCHIQKKQRMKLWFKFNGSWWSLVFSCIPFFRKFAPIKTRISYYQIHSSYW